jgi:hypothetical protein
LTPLLVASKNGHVECVRALLGGGAAINQATVGSSCTVCVDTRDPAGLHVLVVVAGVPCSCGIGEEVFELMSLLSSGGWKAGYDDDVFLCSLVTA